MGDVLPVVLGNYDPFVYEFDVGEFGDLGFNGNFFFGLTWQVYRFIGNQGLLYWVYDAPEAIHRLMSYMLDDRIRLFEYLEREGLLAPNTDNQMAGPRSYGYVSDLPAAGLRRSRSRLKDLWAWAESQESESISPAMYKEFFLPYLARLSERFGLIYYGCCERLDDRLEMIVEAIPNLRSVSVSGWSDLAKTASILGKRYVYSRKPTPASHQRSQPQLGAPGEGHAGDLCRCPGLQSGTALPRRLHHLRRPLPAPPLGRHDQVDFPDVVTDVQTNPGLQCAARRPGEPCESGGHRSLPTYGNWPPSCV